MFMTSLAFQESEKMFHRSVGSIFKYWKTLNTLPPSSSSRRGGNDFVGVSGFKIYVCLEPEKKFSMSVGICADVARRIPGCLI